MSETDSTLRTGVRTTFMPWKTVDMTDGEYRDLDRQGLIVHDPEPAPAPVPVELGKPPTDDGDKTPAPSPVPGGRRNNRD